MEDLKKTSLKSLSHHRLKGKTDAIEFNLLIRSRIDKANKWAQTQVM